MLYLDSPTSLKQQMFAAAAHAHAPEIRLDVDLVALFDFPELGLVSGLQEDLTLSAHYHIPILADVPGDGLGQPNLTRYATELGMLARLAPAIHDFEIVNEPDSSANFTGTPAQYAAMLNIACLVLHPLGDRVVLGGITSPDAVPWVGQVLAAGAHFDIASVHLRWGSPQQLGAHTRDWVRFFSPTPLWVTETGYSSNPSYQHAPGDRDGPASQAQFLARELPRMLSAGAQRIFVTERDNLTGAYAAEGIVNMPAMAVVARINAP